MTPLVVDGHEDIAWNLLTFGRDYTLPVAETRSREVGSEGPLQVGDALLGWQEWVRARVAVIFASLFAAPLRRCLGGWDTQCYADFDEAHRLYSGQLELYRRLADEHADKFRLVRTRADLEQALGTWQGEAPTAPQIGLVIQMEGAEALREADELEAWHEQGVCIVAPSWTGTRFAGGEREPGPLTPEGMELLEVMAELGAILDISHLAEQAVLQALERFPGIVIATHSAARAMLPNSDRPDRHLSNRVLRQLTERDGVIGIVIANHFLKDGWRKGDRRELVTLQDAAIMIDYICQQVGDASHVALGSDLDGGFGLPSVPIDLASVADLPKIGSELSLRGYCSSDVEGILGGSWLRVLRRSLPEA